MIKKILIWTVIIALCLLGIFSYVGYRSFNTEAFKTQVIQSVQEATGRTFTVAGDSKLVWNPLPTLTLEQVTLSNTPNSQNPQMFQAEKIQIQIEWASLFKSPTRIKSLLIVKPEILIERRDRFSTNLEFPLLFAAQNALATESSFEDETTNTQIDNVQIEDGHLTYINQITQQKSELSNINGDLAIGSLSGPFAFEGSATFKELPLKIKTSLGLREIAQPMDIILDIGAKDTDAHINIDLKLHPENTDAYLIGSASFEAEKPNDLLKQLAHPLLPSAYNTNTVGTVSFEIGSSKMNISDFILKIGSDNNTITVDATYMQDNSTPQGNLVLNINTLNLNEWKETLQQALNQPLLTTYPFTFDLTVSQLLWNGQTGSTLNLTGNTEQDQIYVREGSIRLPGSTMVQLEGRFTQGSAPHLLAQIDLQSQDANALLPLFNLPQNDFTKLLTSIKTADLVSTLDWEPNAFTWNISALSVNKATGVASFAKTGKQPLNIVLELANINLNDYSASKSTAEKTDLSTTLKNIFQQLQTLPMPSGSAHLELVLNKALWQKTNFKNITLIADVRHPNTSIEANMTLQNQSSCTLKTTIQNLGTPNWKLTQNKFELEGKDLATVLQNLNIDIPESPWLQNARQFHILGEIKGQPKQWQMDVILQTQAASLELLGQLINKQPQKLAIRLQHQNTSYLLGEFWPQNPLPNLGGSFTLTGILSQKGQLLTMNDLNLQAGTEQVIGTATYNLKDQKWDLTLSADTLDLQKILPDIAQIYLNASGFDDNPLTFDTLKGLKGSLDLTAKALVYQTTVLKKANLKANIADNVLSINNFVTTGDGKNPSTVQAKGTLSWIKTPTFNLKLATQALPLTTPFTMFNGIGLSEGLLTSEWNLASNGETPLQLARNLKGDGKIYLEKPLWIGSDLSNLSTTLTDAIQQASSKELLTTKLRHALTNGASHLAFIQGIFNITDGMWQADAVSMDAAQANSTSINIRWDIPKESIQAKIPLTIKEFSSLPSIILSFNKDQKGVMYKPDMSTFIDAFMEEITRQQMQRQEEERKAQQEAAEQALAQTKQEALAAFQELANLVAFWTQQLSSIPDLEIQKEISIIQVFLTKTQEALQADAITQQQYQNIITEKNKLVTNLEKAQHSFTARQKDTFRQKGSETLTRSTTLISKINELYQKRPALTLLAEILQRSQDQEGIIKRALEQYQKPLTFDQIKQVDNIIHEAAGKITKAYNYAEDLYSGRQNMPSNNSIQRISP